MGQGRPIFRSIVDLGFRDVGVRFEPYRLAAFYGMALSYTFAYTVLVVVVICAMAVLLGSGSELILALGVAWLIGFVALAVAVARRAPILVVRLRAGGIHEGVWIVLAPYVLMSATLFAIGGLAAIPAVVFTVVLAALLFRRRRRAWGIPRLTAQLGEGEEVLGDGIGAERWRLGPCVIAATDRRLLVVPERGELPSADLRYSAISGFGIRWMYGGLAGQLRVTAAGETKVLNGITPANLVSVAQALQSHGVEPDDPDRIAEAARGWEQAKQGGGPAGHFFDRAAMSTRAFDRGLWLLLALSGLVFYVAPLGPLSLLLFITVLCVLCGYVSGTGSSLAYLAPLNLLIVPTFFYTDADGVIVLMIVLSVVASIGLVAGAALRRAKPEPGAARRGLRYAISGLALTRISSVMLGAVVVLVLAGLVAGLQPSTLRLAVEEASADQLAVDGRSNLTGGAASLAYTPGPGLKELVRDQHFGAGPNDGARWELRAPATDGYNVVSLSNYVFEPRLDDPRAVARFVADKDRYHSRVAGVRVEHRVRVVDGRRGYVWNHRARDGSWQYAAWFPQPVHSVRVECIAKEKERRFRRLCAEAMSSLEFR